MNWCKFEDLHPTTMTSLCTYTGSIDQLTIFRFVNILYINRDDIYEEKKSKKKFSNSFIDIIQEECIHRGLKGAIVSVRLREKTRGLLVRDPTNGLTFFKNALTFDVIIGKKPLNIKLYGGKVVVCGAKQIWEAEEGIDIIRKEIDQIISFLSLSELVKWKYVSSIALITEMEDDTIDSPDHNVYESLDDIQKLILNKSNDYDSHSQYCTTLKKMTCTSQTSFKEFSITDIHVEMANYNYELQSDIQLIYFFNTLEGTVRTGDYKRFLYSYQNTIYRGIKLMLPYKPLKKKKALPFTTMQLSSSGHITISGPNPEVVCQSFYLLQRLLYTILVEPINGTMIKDGLVFSNEDLPFDKLLSLDKTTNCDQLEDLDLDI